MGAALLAGQLILVLFFTIFTLNKYANLRNQSLIVLITTFFGWFFSFLIIIVLPLDVSITFFKKCLNEIAVINNGDDNEEITTTTLSASLGFNEPSDLIVPNISNFCEEPKGFVEDRFLFALWRIVYWGSQFLTWILLPMMQSYAKAGEFTLKGRLKYAFYSNAVYYGIYFTLVIFLLLYVLSKGVSLDFASLKVLIVSASNTWGIFLLVVLLGYGLIELPRNFWRMGISGYRLQRAYFDIDKLASEKSETEEAIQEAYRETKNGLNLLKDTRGAAREKIKQIASKFPHEFAQKQTEFSKEGNWQHPSRANSSQLDVDVISQDAYLVKLHRKVINASQSHQRCQVQWRSLIELAFHLEDVEMAESLEKLPSKWTKFDNQNLRKNTRTKSATGGNRIAEKLRFFWHVTLQRPIFQFLAILFTAMTTLILWSECTFFIVHPQLSLAARLLNHAAQAYHYKFIQFGAIAIILYLCICAYYTIFRLRIYRYYRLDPNGMTDENSLIFSAMLICRLTAPLCLNFLGMIHLDSAIAKNQGIKIETQFTKLMGHLEIIPWLAVGINIYLPIVIVLLCLATWFRLGTRFLHNLGIDQFLEEDEMTLEMVRSGKALVSLERNRLNRALGREERNEVWRRRAAGGGMTKSRGEEEASWQRVDTLREKEEDHQQPIVGEERRMEEHEMEERNWLPQNETSTLSVADQNVELGRDNSRNRPQQQGSRTTAERADEDDVLINLSPQTFFDDL